MTAIADINKIQVLPCEEGSPGFVRLVDHTGGDLSIVRSARVSYNADWRSGSDDEKLINYLWKNKHTSPFESVQFTFEVKAPLFVFRQWHRHRTWSYNEISARYTELDEGFYVPDVNQITTQSKSNKQMRTKEVHPNANGIHSIIRHSCHESFEYYKWMLKEGAPRELARGVLPVNAYSRMFATVDLHNLFHFLTLRLHEHAQYEVRVYAEAMLKLIKPIVPVAVRAFEASLQEKRLDKLKLLYAQLGNVIGPKQV
jgi:thymidylate synthase (FAD)